MDVLGMVDKKNLLMLIGCYCNNPKLALDTKYSTNSNDYQEQFHKMIHGAIVNIAKKSNITKITPLEIQTEVAMFPSSVERWQINDGWRYIENAIELTEDKLANVDLYYDAVRKYSILRVAVQKLKIDINFIYDESDENIMMKFNQMTSTNVLAAVYGKFDEFKQMWKNNFGDNYSFHVGDDIESVIVECENQDNTFGYPFQSGYMTTVFRGMKPKKFMIRSSVSGGGKSRNSLAEACNIASDKLYDWQKRKWLSTGEKLPVLFISTELTKEEIQTCLLAHISGIEEDRLTEWKDITPDEKAIIIEAGKVVADSLLFGEYVPDFTIDVIEELIERYIINYGITHCFFDYINDSPSLYSWYIQKTGVKLQTHQILFLFSSALKQLANKYHIYLGSSTQLNSSWKTEKDGNALKGSKAILEKTDFGVLALPVTTEDLKKLKPILDNNFFEQPTMAYYIIKNRSGKWKSIIVWTKINLGTVREKDCFVTNVDFELITNIEPTLIEFQLDDIGMCEPVVNDSSVNVYIDEYNKIQFDDLSI